MKILSRKYNIRADINHVYYCFSDMDYILQEINRLNDSDQIKVVKKNNELLFKEKKNLFTIRELESKRPEYFKSQITPITDNLVRLGIATITSEFYDKGEKTQVIVNITSSKTPSFLIRVIIKIFLLIMNFKIRKDEKRFIQAIEQGAR